MSFASRLASLALIACTALPAAASAQEKPLLVFFSVTSEDARLEEQLPLINAEIFVALQGGGKHRLMTQEQLGEHLIMDPQENLAFCNLDPGCISDMTKEVQASLFLYGDAKLSFDGKKVIVHLVLVDTLAKKQADERFGQLPMEGTLVQQTGDLVRDLLKLPPPAPVEPPRPEPAKAAAGEDLAPGPGGVEKAPAATAEKEKKAAAVQVVAQAGPDPWTNPWTWTTFAVGLATLGAGVALGVVADQEEADAANAANQGRPQHAYDLLEEASDLALGANISFGIGGALVLTGVVLFIVDAAADGPAEAPAREGGGSPAFLPGLGCSDSGCGGSLTLRF